VSIATPILGRLLRGAWGLLGTWTWVQVRKRPAHTATTMGSLAAGVAFALCMATLLGSYRQEFVRWMNRTFEADVFVNAGSTLSLLGGPTVDSALQHELEELPGVRSVLPWRLVEVQFRGQPIIVQGMAESLIDRAQSGVALDHDRGEVVVSDTLAERYGLRVGDPLSLPAPFGPLRLTIKAVAPDYTIDLGNVKIGWRTFSRYFGENDANVLLVDAREGIGSRELKRAIEERVGGRYDVTVLTNGELRQLVGALLDQSFALTRWLEVLAVLVTICAMINATSAAIIDRAEHLTTLRALGMLRGRLVALLVIEAGLVGALGSVLGLAGGSLLGATLVDTVARRVAGFRLAVHWPVAAMTALVALSAASAAGAAYCVARRWTARTAELTGDAGLAA